MNHPRILYGVAGEGFGHSSKSHIIGKRLMQAGCDVMFAASAKSLSYLSPLFPGQVERVHGLHLIVRNGQVCAISTVADNLIKYSRGHFVNRQLFNQKVRAFAPDLVISDFEPFTAWWAFRNRVPCVFIDHQHLLTMAKLDSIPGLTSWLKAQFVTRSYHTCAQAYVITSFFDAPLKTSRAVLANPVIRRQVTELKTAHGSHITVYSNDSNPETKQRLISTLNAFPSYPFYIYGFNVEQEYGNCLFKKINTDGFLRDLSTGSGVISTAGMSLISECLYLKKWMYLTPLKGQFEQQLNAAYAERLGVAVQSDIIEQSRLKRFFDLLDKDYSADSRILWPDNEAFFAILEQTLHKTGFSLSLTRTPQAESMTA